MQRAVERTEQERTVENGMVCVILALWTRGFLQQQDIDIGVMWRVVEWWSGEVRHGAGALVRSAPREGAIGDRDARRARRRGMSVVSVYCTVCMYVRMCVCIVFV